MSIAYYICANVSEDDEDYEVFLDVSGKAIADVDEEKGMHSARAIHGSRSRATASSRASELYVSYSPRTVI